MRRQVRNKAIEAHPVRKRRGQGLSYAVRGKRTGEWVGETPHPAKGRPDGPPAVKRPNGKYKIVDLRDYAPAP